MNRFGIGLIAAAVTAGLPAMVMAQPPADGQDRPDRASRAERQDGRAPRERYDEQRGQQRPAEPRAQPPATRAPSALRPQSFDQQDRQRAGEAQYRGRDGNGRGYDRRGDDGHGFDARDGGRFGQDRGGEYRGGGRYAGGPGGYDGRGGDRRHDSRYDWRGFRAENRDRFRAGRYVAPRGWGYGYRRFSIGFRLPPFLYGANYWLNDPWSYHLPPADGPYRWVRYYNDVLLIDLRTGEVVDENPDFFW